MMIWGWLVAGLYWLLLGITSAADTHKEILCGVAAVVSLATASILYEVRRK